MSSDSECQSSLNSEAPSSSTSSLSDLDLYDEDPDNADPMATEEEQAAYLRQFEEEQAEENELSRRLRGESGINTWCTCSNCSLEHIVEEKECRCCREVPEIVKRLEVEEEGVTPGQCITQHPGFAVNCLNEWVLDVAGVGLKTKAKKSYTTLLNRGRVTQSEYFRAVAYRQFVRLIWRFVGASRRFPLPACVYHKIRTQFPSVQYTGFEEAEEDEEEAV